MIKPLLKWIGGKNQLCKSIIESFPREFRNYYEPFLGGGSVLLSLLQSDIKYNKIYVNDNNKTLIAFYKNIQSDKDIFYNSISPLIQNYKICKDKGEYYYSIRNSYNALSEEDKCSYIGSAYFLFLNKTGFRGMYRISGNGFNVPFGNYKNPEICNYEHLCKFSDLIRNVEFFSSDYVDFLKDCTKDDFVYADPPYYPIKKSSFVSYSKDGFNEEQHMRLFNLFLDAPYRFIMSNSDTEKVRDFFPVSRFIVENINVRRRINSKNPESIAKEVLVYNF